MNLSDKDLPRAPALRAGGIASGHAGDFRLVGRLCGSMLTRPSGVPGGAGIGLAVRLAIDSLNRDYTEEEGVDQELRDNAMATQQHWIDAAASLAVDLPEVVPSTETSEVWKSLADEMRMARQVAEVSYMATSLHMQPGTSPIGWASVQSLNRVTSPT